MDKTLRTLQEAIENLERVVEVVLVAEQALYGNNLRALEDWGRPSVTVINPLSY
jgi:hypothetical protein